MADSQRKTANLFDGNLEQGTTSYGTLIPATNRVRSNVFYLGAGTFTFSCTDSENYQIGLDYHSSDGTYVEGTSWLTSKTFDVTNSAPQIRLKIKKTNDADFTPQDVNSVMLNAGSTPLPYEPYGWLHSLRKLDTATDTLTTLPADLYADGNNATAGLVGNMSQTGTPTPQNPITPSECGDRTGNLFNGTIEYGSFQADGSLSNYTETRVRCSFYDKLPSGTYTINATGVDDVVLYCYTQQDTSTYVDISEWRSWQQLPFTFTITEPLYVRFALRKRDNSDIDIDTVADIMLNTGGTALPYQPYGYKLDIKSASTTTPVYLGEVQSTRKIKKLVLTGQENWTKNDAGNPSNYLYYQTGYLANKTCVCSHLADMGTLSTSKVGVFNGNNVLYINFGSAIMNAQPSGNTVAGLKEYFADQYAAGTPVCVWYVLETPTTGIVNEPLRKIGDYADTISGITIPTITGKDTFDVLTTLKPSEVSLTYTGWHDASVKEWDGSQWQ